MHLTTKAYIMQKSIINFSIAILLLVFSVAAFAPVAHAQLNLGTDQVTSIGFQQASTDDPKEFIADIVAYLMTFLGLIAVIVILIGGFRWLTAAGNEDKVASAKKTIIAGAIGLAVILAAYAIVNFVINITQQAVIDGTL